MKNSDYKKIEVVNSENETIAASTEFSIIDNRIILHGEDFPLLDHNSAVKVIAFSKDGIVSMDGIVTMSIRKQMNINVVEFREKKERRSYLKVRTDAKAIVRKAFMGAAEEASSLMRRSSYEISAWAESAFSPTRFSL